eukprot:4324916-Amphidinium_carterae.1
MSVDSQRCREARKVGLDPGLFGPSTLVISAVFYMVLGERERDGRAHAHAHTHAHAHSPNVS